MYDPPASEPDYDDSFADVNIYYHMDRMDTFWRTAIGLPMGYGLVAVSNYAPGQQPYGNAAFTPWEGEYKNLIIIGQDSNLDFAYDSDVFLHEMTHYVNHNAIGFSNGAFDFDQYGYVVMPGAIDEGSADYFSCTVNDDPIVGAASLGYYSRDLEETPVKCPDGVVGEAPRGRQVIGTASWAIRKELGNELADQIVGGVDDAAAQPRARGLWQRRDAVGDGSERPGPDR